MDGVVRTVQRRSRQTRRLDEFFLALALALTLAATFLTFFRTFSIFASDSGFGLSTGIGAIIGFLDKLGWFRQLVTTGPFEAVGFGGGIIGAVS